ncbi:protein of unknown function UPF0182 [Gloeothece citriformis PCC 7424]|uniref:UPF0182 protein PCC7424_5177 n=1 Tax=Gloeothece citriformis (strain PCC 7424) TaxID=65393 RepID=B7KI40_GLOC7|nr:UPF0182 family protein [Gloeothece citriformis]ACK73527.1 protein of unknown function UPF0182 [Gloeothece citriformis PCC 7424]
MKRVIYLILIIAGFWLGIELITRLIIEILWFQEVGYLSSFLKRLLCQLILFIGVTGISASFLFVNLHFAHKYKWHSIPESLPKKYPHLKPIKDTRLTPQSISFRLPWLLFFVVICYLIAGVMLFYYSQLAFEVWTPKFNLANVNPPVLLFEGLNWFWNLIPSLPQNLLKLGAFSAIIFILFLKAELWITTIAGILSLLFGLIFAGNWTNVFKYLNSTPFKEFDPQFSKDVGFYVFTLPISEWLFLWLAGLIIYGVVTVSITYLLSGNSLSEGKFPGFSRPQLRHLYGLWGAVMAILVWRHILNRYELLYSSRGVIYGAGYTDIHVQQYVEIGLGIIAGLSAFWLFFKSISGASKPKLNPYYSRSKLKKISYHTAKTWYKLPFYLWFIILYLFVLIMGQFSSLFIQMLVVQPNELARERPYIARSINYTRAGFDLDKINAKIFDPEGVLTAEDIRNNALTIENIRLWDTQPLLQTNRQLQQIRLYYKFLSAEIDRYLMKTASTDQNDPFVPDTEPKTNDPNLINTTTEKQQVIIAARELDYEEVPDTAKTWVNEHLVYTHGYGFTLSPVNLVAEGGLPYYFVRDIGTSTDEGALQTSSEFIQYSIPITKPRIYFGQLTNTYVMTPTSVQEFDFPSGEENVYNTYDGAGGIQVGSWWRRGLFAIYLKDWQMLFTTDFLPDTKLLFRRQIDERIRTIAPFLQYDQNPYLVVADIGDTPPSGIKNTLYWIVDAYTISDRYPYSDPGENQYNYIRNSVKVVIDAYNGDVKFYIADPSDPIIKTWSKVFPAMFRSLDEMPINLRTHIRYPEDFFSAQSEQLLIYHMTDPQVFYNREDQWQIPREIYGNKTQSVAPYYLIMRLPEETQEEFILLHPYTPRSRPNLIGWLAGRSDGEQYGKLLLYLFPKQRLIYGSNQIEALINQDPAISQQISLWNREGSSVLQGNLLVIPIEQSLLYVEPLYLVAEENSVPTLARVIVFYENQIVMAPRLEEALTAIFEPEQSSTPAIIRPVEGL